MNWIRVENRSMSQVFRCPICDRTCKCNKIATDAKGKKVNIIDYEYCPYCKAKLEYSDDYEVWHGMDGKLLIVPKGTFDALYNDDTEDDDDI